MKRLRSEANAVAASEDGAAILEFVLVLPILLALLGGAFEFGRMLLVNAALDGAVRGGARYLARVADPSCRPICSASAARAVALARDQILESTSLSAGRVRVYPLVEVDPGSVALRAEVDLDITLLGWAGLGPTLRLSATHSESRVAE